MGDELVWNGLDPASLQESAALVKATFPDAIVWENEATDPLVSGVLPCLYCCSHYNRSEPY